MGVKPVQNQFNGGEISPLMGARFDLPVYQYSGAVVLNFIPTSEGYIKRRGGTHFVASAKEVDAVLFTIVPNVEDAKIIINNVEQESCYCAPGDTVTYTVSAEGYASKSGTYRVTEDTSLPVNLVSSTIKYTFAITSTPEDAVVMINGIARKTVTAGANSRIEWSVSKTGYATQSGVIEALSENKSIVVALKMRFSIKASPEGAKIIINGVERSYIDVDPGTKIDWSVSKEGYQTQSGSQTMTSSIELVISLSSQSPGQVMFESSAPGTYNVRVEDGLYELIMSGAGGNGYYWEKVMSNLPPRTIYTKCSGGAGASFKGVLSLRSKIYEIFVGAVNAGSNNGAYSQESRFSDIISVGGGSNSSESKGLGGIITIKSAEEIVSSEINQNGDNGKASIKSYDNPSVPRVYASLPQEYRNTFGYGGAGEEWKTSGGTGFVRLVYIGKAS